MPFDYRKPGVYVEESLLVNTTDLATATSTALFVGTAGTGPVSGPVRCSTWSDYVVNFGGFDPITDPTDATVSILSYLPYAVYSYFQNGGRPAYVQRAIGTAQGDVAFYDVPSGTDVAFVVEARSVGAAGNNLGVSVTVSDAENGVFNLSIYKDDVETERFQHLTLNSDIPGTRRVEDAVNDPYSGSTLVRVSSVSLTASPDSLSAINLSGGADPGLPAAEDYEAIAQDAVAKIEGPLIVNLVGFMVKSSGSEEFVAPGTVSAASFPDRSDIFIINDNVAPRAYGQSSANYKSTITSTLSRYTGDSYVASFTPWIIVADPRRAGSTITIPPGGAVAGTISRVDSTIGVFRAPAGVVAGISNAVGVDTKYSDSELGDLNAANINVIRPVAGTGVAIMGARTRKLYGADRYISARRTLIYIKESLKRSTAFALFENNDMRLWTQLHMTAERLLRPLWEAGGLRGVNAAEAYYIKCDESINTPSVIASGEVRMEIGVALEYPAEFIVIKVTQYESGGFSAEVQPRG